MKKIFFIVYILLINFNLYSEPFIKINYVDSHKEYPYVNINVSILNTSNSYISDISDDNISIYEDGYKVNYVQVKKNDGIDDIVYLIFSVDSSKSIPEDSLKKIKAAAQKLIIASKENEKLSLYKFNDEVVILNSFNVDKNQVLENLKSIKRHGSKTLLYNSIYDSIDLLNKIKVKRKTILVFTDGKDEGSSVNLEDIVKFSRDSSISLNFACLKSSKNKNVLSRIAKLTGGQLAYVEDENNILKTYSKIIDSLKNQYNIKYRTVLKGDGRLHDLEIRFKSGSIRDRIWEKIKLPYKIFDFDKPSFIEIMLIVLIGIFFLIIVALIFYIVKRDKEKIVKEKVFIEPVENYPKTEKYISAFDGDGDGEDDKPVYPINTENNDASYYKCWLVQKEGPESGKKFPIYWDEITLGRSKENSIVITDNSVSLKHAKVKKGKDSYILFDMASENGTYLNNKKLLRPKPLYDWDEILIGRTQFIFRGSKIK